MWTPWRILLLLFGLFGCVVAYLVYAHILGALDGHRPLPERYLERGGPSVNFRTQAESPTVQKLQEAFGVGSPEAEDNKVVYKTKVQLPDKGLVIAAGQMDFKPEGDRFVPVSPVSLAVFGKGKTNPGDMPDISTFYADRAVLEFSHKVSRLQDLTGDKAKLIGIELISANGLDPLGSNEPGSEDKRKGYIWITNNQKSADPTEHIVARTPGPVFYRVPDETVPHNPDVAQVWTAAPVEVFDRKNLPRTYRFTPPRPDPRRRYAVNDVLGNVAPVTALARPEDLRRRSAIADILNGAALPPPTISAVGLKIFFAPPPPKQARGAAPPPRKEGNLSGIRQLVFTEKVQMNLWTDGGFPGEGQNSAEKPADPVKPLPDPPLGLAAMTGSVLDGAAIGERHKKKSLLLIETPGSFRYDFEKEEAHFDVASQQLPAGQANFVTVTRLNAAGGQDNLFCSTLTLDLSSQPPPAAAKTPTTPPPAAPDNQSASRTGRSIRGLLARGEYVCISIESEGLTAQGTELDYRRDQHNGNTTTVLRGMPVHAVSDGNELKAGDKVTQGQVIIESSTLAASRPGVPPRRTNTLSVRGPGSLELFDNEGAKNPKQPDTASARARWGKALTHTKDNLGGKEVDLFKFDGGGEFVDLRSDFTLTADVIHLWLANQDGARPAVAKSEPARNSPKADSGNMPERLLADGNVDVRSPELMVKQTDKLTVWFRDVPPPKANPLQPPKNPGAVAAAPPPLPPASPLPAMPIPSKPLEAKIAVAPMAVAEPAAEPAVPIYLSARVVETWVVRYPLPQPAPAGAVPPNLIQPARADVPPAAGPAGAAPPKLAVAGNAPRGGKLKYDLERALCEDRVHVQQESTDPKKGLPGMDIKGIRLELDHSSVGSVARVFGTAENFASVQYEGLQLFGREVLIDQPGNEVDVKGAGRLKMLSDSDLSGNRLDTPSDLDITWTHHMQFWGAKAAAVFVGNVKTQQFIEPTAPLPPRPLDPKLANAPAAEAAPPPKPLADANPNTTRYALLSHCLDVTFDKPIYFNQLSRKKEKPGVPEKPDDRPKLKTAVGTPMPDDEIRKLADITPSARNLATNVYFFEEVFRPDHTYAQARILTAKQIDFANREKEQDLMATGPGELRLLQPGNADDAPAAAPTPPPVARPGAPAANDDAEMKLTVVTFRQKMNAKDQAKVFQEAAFPDGAVVIRIPATDPRLEVEAHNLPASAVTLTCEKSLVVSSSKPGKGAKPETRLVANGNANFIDKTYQGNGEKITYTSMAVVFDGTPTRLATLYHRKVGLNDRQYHQARQIIYRKDGSVSVTGSGGGALTPGG